MSKTATPETFACISLVAPPGQPHAISMSCPCGFTVQIPVNRWPMKDTPHPCGNPNHWTVKYDGGECRTPEKCALPVSNQNVH